MAHQEIKIRNFPTHFRPQFPPPWYQEIKFIECGPLDANVSLRAQFILPGKFIGKLAVCTNSGPSFWKVLLVFSAGKFFWPDAAFKGLSCNFVVCVFPKSGTKKHLILFCYREYYGSAEHLAGILPFSLCFYRWFFASFEVQPSYFLRVLTKKSIPAPFWHGFLELIYYRSVAPLKI